MITLLKAGWVAAWDGSRHLLVEGGEVAMQDETILYAGPCFEGVADRIIHRPEWFITPGFINLHGHIGVEVFSSLVDLPDGASVGPSESFVKESPLFMPPTLTPEQQRLGAEFSLVQMLRTGSTTVVDAHGYGPVWWLGNPPDDEEALVDIVGRVGSRAYLALGFRSARSYLRPDGRRAFHWDEEMGRAGLQEGLRFALEFDGAHNGRVRCLLAPHHTMNCTPDLLTQTLEAARENDLGVTVHAAEYMPELEMIRERHGETPVGMLHRFNLMGPDVILGHCLYTSGHPTIGGDLDRDLDLIAAAGSSVAHAPRQFAQSGVAMYSLPRYLDHGVNVGIGCDIWPADIIEEMRVAWFMGKHANRTAERPTSMEVFTAATVGSADALGRDDLGRLAPGARADLVCIDLSGYHFGTVIDPVRSLVAFGNGQDVDDVYVDGRLIVDGGNVLNADSDRLQAAAPAIHHSLARAVQERDPLARPLESVLGLEAVNG
jgi:cytosine/adenosine deaminase-related metal-dependent hydrolase